MIETFADSSLDSRASDDKFIVDNLLGVNDVFDLPDLDSNWMQDFTNNNNNNTNDLGYDVESTQDYLNFLNSDFFTSDKMDILTENMYPLNGLTPPDTPPSSDRSSPPLLSDSFQLQTNSNVIHSVQTNMQTLVATSHLPAILPVITAKISNKDTNQSKRNSIDEKLYLSQLKKEARKLRNRESANCSRRKKQEKLESLEAKVNELLKENSSLRDENIRLKSKVNALEAENLMIKQTINPNGAINKRKAALSLFAIVFMLGFNIFPFTGILLSNNELTKSVPTNAKSVGHVNGRTLLWTNDDTGPEVNIFDNFPSKNNKNDFVSNSTQTDCQSHINKTESLRLEKELRGFALRNVKLKSDKQGKQMKRRYSHFFDANDPKKSTHLTSIEMQKTWFEQKSENQVDLYKRKLNRFPVSYNDLLKAIHPRDDTFYFVSFSSIDHLLVPAETNTTKVRPRFSILMPELSKDIEKVNETGLNTTYEQMAMMQIDCEVLNMKMVMIKNLVSLQSTNSQLKQRKEKRQRAKPVSYNRQ